MTRPWLLIHTTAHALLRFDPSVEKLNFFFGNKWWVGQGWMDWRQVIISTWWTMETICTSSYLAVGCSYKKVISVRDDEDSSKKTTRLFEIKGGRRLRWLSGQVLLALSSTSSNHCFFFFDEESSQLATSSSATKHPNRHIFLLEKKNAKKYNLIQLLAGVATWLYAMRCFHLAYIM